MTDKFTMTIGQAHELSMACGRNGLDAAAVKFLSKGKNLQKAMKLLGWKSGTSFFSTKDYWIVEPERKLWVSNEFKSYIISAFLDPTPHRGLEGVTHFQSKSSDVKNIAEMGGEAEVRKHAFTPDQIADLRDKQVNGEGGQLLTNGYRNLFYVIGKDEVLFVVGLGWRGGDRVWDVYAWHLGEDDDWHSDIRVFRNTLDLEA